MKFEYNTDDYIRKINSGNSYFNTFLDKNTLAAGVLVLKPGEEDTQLPHESDEMYYILEGDGFLKIKNKKYKLKKGKAFFEKIHEINQSILKLSEKQQILKLERCKRIL